MHISPSNRSVVTQNLSNTALEFVFGCVSTSLEFNQALECIHSAIMIAGDHSLHTISLGMLNKFQGLPSVTGRSPRQCQPQWLVLTFDEEVGLKSLPQSAGVGSHDVVFGGVVVDPAFKDLHANLLFVELIAPTQQSLLAYKLEEGTETTRLRQVRGGDDPLYELPPRIGEQPRMTSSRTLFSQSRSWHSKSILSSREYWMSVRVKKEPKGFRREEVRPIFPQVGLVRYSLDTSTALLACAPELEAVHKGKLIRQD